MLVEIKVPSVGESVTEAVLAQWFKKDGDQVQKGEALFVIETDKVTLEVEAEAEGVLKISTEEGETVSIGAVVGSIDTAAAAAAAAPTEKAAKEEERRERAHRAKEGPKPPNRRKRCRLRRRRPLQPLKRRPKNRRRRKSRCRPT